MENELPLQRRRPNMKPVAIGLMLAVPVLSVVAIFAAYLQYKALQKAEPAIKSAKQFIMLVGSGQVGPAKGMSKDEITEEKLTQTAEEFQAWGAIKEINEGYGGAVHSDSDIEVQVLLEFDAAKKVFVSHWDVTSGVPRLGSYEFKEAPKLESTKQTRTEAR